MSNINTQGRAGRVGFKGLTGDKGVAVSDFMVAIVMGYKSHIGSSWS